MDGNHKGVSEEDKIKFKMKETETVGTVEVNTRRRSRRRLEQVVKAINLSTWAMRLNAEKEAPDQGTTREKAAAKSE